MDNWEQSEIKLLSCGGNQRLRYFLIDYSLPQFTDPNYKYFICALDYYRKLLKYEAEGGEKSLLQKPIKPDSMQGLDFMSTPIKIKKNESQTTPNQKQNSQNSRLDNGNNMSNEINNNNRNSYDSRTIGYNNNIYSSQQPQPQYFEKPYDQPSRISQSYSQPQPKKTTNPKGFFDEVSDIFEDAGVEWTKMINQMGSDIKQSKIEEKLAIAGKDTKEAFESFGKKAKGFFSKVKMIIKLFLVD